MPGRKIQDEADARACLDAATRSGLPRVEWARAHGVDARSLNAWRLNLERRGRTETPVPLRLVELVPPEPSPAPAGSGVRLRIGDIVVELDRNFDEAVLARALDLVAPC